MLRFIKQIKQIVLTGYIYSYTGKTSTNPNCALARSALEFKVPVLLITVHYVYFYSSTT